MSVEPTQRKDPRHVGIIMDGNGRWAKQRGLSRPQGHEEGAKATRRVIEACQDLHISHLTLYAFSSENWNRPEQEVQALMELLEYFLGRETKTLVERRVRLHAIGRIDELPASARDALKKAMDATAAFQDWHLTLALNYSSRLEVLDAARSFAKSVAAGEINADSATWQDFAQRLYTRELPDPDLIIRTSGETRISNFLLLQSAYAEFYFTEVLWPDFDKAHLEHAVAAYRCRERRFGKTSEQIIQPTAAS